jgi:murein DD-endopeptidase MepM/ murein hydrolase activator NlpD
MKYPLPLEIVKGRFPFVTQEFGNQTNNAWYIANGIKFDASSGGGHNGTDIVIAGGKNQATDTYGTKLVNPFPKALRNKVWFEDAMSTQGNGVKVQFTDERGVIKMIVWHCSECNNQEEYNLGDTLGYIGNSGLVTPKPTVWNAHAGAHLHLGVYINDVLANPRDVFDFTKWTVSNTDTSIEKDLPPIAYFLNQIRITLSSIFK